MRARENAPDLSLADAGHAACLLHGSMHAQGRLALGRMHAHLPPELVFVLVRGDLLFSDSSTACLNQGLHILMAQLVMELGETCLRLHECMGFEVIETSARSIFLRGDRDRRGASHTICLSMTIAWQSSRSPAAPSAVVSKTPRWHPPSGRWRPTPRRRDPPAPTGAPTRPRATTPLDWPAGPRWPW